jgi:hypothetical protein
MSRPITEYRCLLISPGDVTEEREGLAKAVDRWNAQVGDALDARVRLVRWETDRVPDASAPPQQVLNRQIVDESDFEIALFWARLGTPTGTHAAGSLEEIEQLQRRGARVLIYFKNAPVPQELLKDDQYARVSEFKTKMEKKGLLGTFSGTNDLVQPVLLHLTGVVADLLKRDRAQPQPDENKQAVLTAPKPDVRAAGLRDGQILTGRISVTNNDPQRAALFPIRDNAGEREVQFFPRGQPVQAWQYQIGDCSNGR